MAYLKLRDQESMTFSGHFGEVEVKYHAAEKWFEGCEAPGKFTAAIIEGGMVRAIADGPTETQAVQNLYQEFVKIIACRDTMRFAYEEK